MSPVSNNSEDEIRNRYFYMSRMLYNAIAANKAPAEINNLKEAVEQLHKQLKSFDSRDPASLILE